MINLQENKKDEVVYVKQQEKKKTKVWVNSIEPKQGHNLFEFFYRGDYFECFEIDLSLARLELVLINVNGKFVNKAKHEKPTIDIFNPEFKAAKKSFISYQFNPEAIYITALNYRNACKKLKSINSHLF
jgi:hypothetical protein